jgi:hypothetical protein
MLGFPGSAPLLRYSSLYFMTGNFQWDMEHYVLGLPGVRLCEFGIPDSGLVPIFRYYSHNFMSGDFRWDMEDLKTIY